MKPIFHEVKPVNGIPTITDQQIQDIISHNPFRDEKHKVSAELINSSLESLKLIYANHTGIKKKEIPPGLVIGPPCPHCQNEFYRQTGVCLTCVNCSESSSCS